jgi:hypothetical protein
MKRLDYILLTALIALGVVVGYQARGIRPYIAAGAIGVDAPARSAARAGGADDVGARGGEVARNPDEVRRRLQIGEAGTYIGEVLADHDSALARWPDRTARPLRVWIQPSSPVSDWRPEFVRETRDAFTRWQETGIPVRFDFVADSAQGDVHVGWIDRFDEPISGKTLWARDGRWWIIEANITLAVHHRGGEPLDVSAMRAIALHEVGHLLGLDHTADPTNIMTPKVRVRDLSSADQATVRLLYTLPPGSVR